MRITSRLAWQFLQLRLAASHKSSHPTSVFFSIPARLRAADWPRAGSALENLRAQASGRAKFTEAEKCAPHWGHLHLKWGEAPSYAGKKDDAQKQFALAAGLDLSSADKAELAKQT